MSYEPVSAEQFSELEGVGDWSYADNSIRAEYAAGSFTAAGELAASIARAADDADHHPDIDLRYPDQVVVVLTSHSAGGVTQADVELARTISQLASEAGASSDAP